MATRLKGNDSYIAPIKTFTCDKNIKTFDESEFDRKEAEKLEKPDFRGFVLATSESILRCRMDIRCLLNIEIHYRGQALKCSTCKMRYDAIVKVQNGTKMLTIQLNELKILANYNLSYNWQFI